MRRLGLLLLLLVIVSAACALDGAPDDTEISDVARAYLDAVFDILEGHSIYRYEIEWPDLRDEAFVRASRAQTPDDAYDTIRWVLRSLGDGHSMFLEPEDAAALLAADLEGNSIPTGRLLDREIGLLTVPGFAGSEESARAYAETLHHLICGLRGEGAEGWIVDLRGNVGGDMWAMLCGVGPILGEGAAGAFVGPDDLAETWSYQAGSVLLDDVVQLSVCDSAVCPTLTPLPPVAVLIDRGTLSAGEATAVAFIGREDARHFGRVTTGMSTANCRFDLIDGAMILLTVSRFADREGTVYGSVIPPDVHVASHGVALEVTDPAVDAALRWLEGEYGIGADAGE